MNVWEGEGFGFLTRMGRKQAGLEEEIGFVIFIGRRTKRGGEVWYFFVLKKTGWDERKRRSAIAPFIGDHSINNKRPEYFFFYVLQLEGYNFHSPTDM